MRWPAFCLFLLATSVAAQTASINGGTVYQTMDGFGASTGFVEQNDNMNSTEGTQYFSQSSGIGLSWVRIQDCGSVSNTAPAGCTPDLPTLQYAVANGAQVFITFDFPSAGTYSTQAAFVVAKLQYLASNGVPVAVVSPVNEPGNGNTWTAAQIAAFIPVLSSALSSAGLTTKIAMPESGVNFVYNADQNPRGDYSDYCFTTASSTCAPLVSYAAQHGYTTLPYTGYAPPNNQYIAAPSYFGTIPGPIHVWQSEIDGNISFIYGCSSSGDPAYDGSIADGLGMATNIHNFLTIQNGSLYMWWNLVTAHPEVTPNGCNDALASSAYASYPPRFYVMGNWAKFVRPGQVRIGATANPQSGVYVTAFLNQSTGAFEIVAINTNSGSVSQIFALSGLSASAMTPWITSGSLNLAQQANVAVSSGSFTYTIPGSSVTTFVSNSSGTTCAATSCSQSAVTAALACVTSATTLVTIPAGTCAWTSPINWAVPSGNPNLTIQGQTTVSCTGTPGNSSFACTAADNTVIQDSITTSANSTPWVITMAGASSHFTMSNLTIEGGSGIVKNDGMLNVNGPGNNLRLTQMHFNPTTYTTSFSTFSMEVGGQVEGVIDHTICDNGGSNVTSNCIGAFNNIGDTIGYGDGTWANSTDFGGSDFIFMEDDIFNGGEAQDCADAGKFVIRYSRLFNGSYGSATIHSHGTKTQGGRGRGCRAYEAYNNYIVGPTASGNGDAVVGSAGGPSLIYNNTIASGYNWLSAVSTTRNDGSATETNTPNGWGYCGTIVNGNGVGSNWDGNTGNPTSGNGYPCMDGIGRGITADPLNGQNWPNALNSVTGTIAWPVQKLEPIYDFNNAIGAAAQCRINAGDTADIFNRDIYCAVSPFTGAAGTGSGPAASRPTSCTAGPGGTYGASPTGSYGTAYYATDTGVLSICTATNTWGVSFNPTYTYPHPLDGGTSLFTLTITTVGTGSGSVSGPNCSSGNYASGTSVGACNATPSAGSTFTGWSTSGSASCTGTSACGPFTLSASTNLQATFTLSSTLNLTISIVGTGSGTVTGTNCTTGVYSSGTSIGACTAVPGAGSTFSGWLTTGSASCTGTSACGPFTISANTNLQATFTATTACGNPTQNPPNYSGTYSSPPTVLPLSVSWTSPTAGCNMFMTLDTSAPTCSGTPYAAQSFTTTTTMRVIACQTGFTSSVIEGGTWTILTTAASPTNLNGVLVQGTGVKIQ